MVVAPWPAHGACKTTVGADRSLGLATIRNNSCIPLCYRASRAKILVRLATVAGAGRQVNCGVLGKRVDGAICAPSTSLPSGGGRSR